MCVCVCECAAQNRNITLWIENLFTYQGLETMPSLRLFLCQKSQIKSAFSISLKSGFQEHPIKQLFSWFLLEKETANSQTMAISSNIYPRLWALFCCCGCGCGGDGSVTFPGMWRFMRLISFHRRSSTSFRLSFSGVSEMLVRRLQKKERKKKACKLLTPAGLRQRRGGT